MTSKTSTPSYVIVTKVGPPELHGKKYYVHTLVSPQKRVVRTMASYSPIAPEALRRGQAVGNSNLMLNKLGVF